MIRSRVWAVLALLGAGVLLGTLAAAPRIWFAILPHLQPHVTRWYLGAGAVAAISLGAWAAGAGEKRRLASFGALVGLLATYVALLFGYYRGEPPAKRIHLLEYGILAGVTLQAVRVDTSDRRGLLLALAFLFLVGTADETAQRFIPMRTFRWLDLFANYVGAALGALAWTAASPESPWRRPARGVR